MRVRRPFRSPRVIHSGGAKIHNVRGGHQKRRKLIIRTGLVVLALVIVYCICFPHIRFESDTANIIQKILDDHDAPPLSDSQNKAAVNAKDKKNTAENEKTAATEEKEKTIGTTTAAATATIDQVVEFLTSLAHMPTAQLQQALDPSANDVFELSQLDQGKCPRHTNKWLPPQPSDDAARLFRNRNEPHRNRSRNKKSRRDPIPLLWYEHLSKAGGTSFCKLAGTNMHKSEVPRYYCMPSTKTDPDARVGLWTNEHLATYMQDGTKRIVSNEWNPFDPVRFEPTTNNAKLVFVTTLRSPLNRLLSAYKFWGILHGPKHNPPTLTQWLNRRHKQSIRAQIPDYCVGCHVGRYNFATWKFSNGTMPFPLPPEPRSEAVVPPNTFNYEGSSGDNDDVWRIPFGDAIRALSRFDLVIPLEALWKNSRPLRDVLGWTDLEEVHVVPAGEVVNTDALSKLSPDQYDVLWDANRLDFVLHAWSRAVYMARMNCGTEGWGLLDSPEEEV